MPTPQDMKNVLAETRKGGKEGGKERRQEGKREGRKERKEGKKKKNSLWFNLTKRKVIGGIGRPFLTAFTVNVFLFISVQSTK